MSITGDFGTEVLQVVRECGNNQLLNSFFEGYDEAAAICMHVVEMRAEELHARIIDGCVLSEKEQFLLAQLSVLKKEMDDALKSSIEQKD